MSTIKNAAPQVISLGTKDSSTRVVPQQPLQIPQHLPKFYIFAEKGPIGPNYVDLNNTTLTSVYGANTFDLTQKYFTHQTVFLNGVVSQGNNCVVHRCVAPDAKDTANVTLYLDVLPTQVPLYEKNSDGSLKLDANNDPIVKLDSENNPITIQGYKVKWVTSSDSVPLGQYQVGLKTVRQGTQSANGVQSQQYPILEFAASSQGEFGNSLAVRLYPALQTDLVPFPFEYMSEGKFYPYYLQLHQLVNANKGLMNPVLNSFGSQYVTYSLEKGSIDPSSEAVVDIEKVVGDNYISNDPNMDTGIGSVKLYSNNLLTLLQMFYAAESVIDDPHRDSQIDSLSENYYALNVFSFTSSNGSPYQSLKLIDDIDSVRLTSNTNIFLSGSSDGSIDEDVLDALVAQDLLNYQNPLHEYQDLVLHPESIIYDSGFTLQTKKALAYFISLRKDTFVVLTTYAHNAPALTLQEHYSVGIALKTMLTLFPESSEFGTPTMRGMIIPGSGNLIGSNYNNRVAASYEIAYKSAAYMGAADGSWKPGFIFDKAPGSVITQLTNIDVSWVPASTRVTLWTVGINFILNYQIRTQFFPALKTVYNNDTSVLNSYFTAMAICYLNKVLHAAWREFSGTISYTNAQLEDAVNNFIYSNTKDKFDNKFIIQPATTVTEMDALRGFSWTASIKIYANNAKTVETAYVEAFRMEDLVTNG